MREVIPNAMGACIKCGDPIAVLGPGGMEPTPATERNSCNACAHTIYEDVKRDMREDACRPLLTSVARRLGEWAVYGITLLLMWFMVRMFALFFGVVL